MKRNPFAYTVKHKITSLFMLVALLWLTMSLPFVYAAQQQLSKEKIAVSSAASSDKEDDSNNPFANTTEEKAPTNVNPIAEEYLHHADFSSYHFSIPVSHNKSGDVATYTAFHGELLSPPPDL
jgi:hypothetical protein